MNHNDTLVSHRNSHSAFAVVTSKDSDLGVSVDIAKLATNSFNVSASSRRRWLAGTPAAYVEWMGCVVKAQAISEHCRRRVCGRAVTDETGEALVEWLVCTSLLAGIAVFCAEGLPAVMATALSSLLTGLRTIAP